MVGFFDELSVVQTSRALILYAPGLFVFSMYKLIVPVFYALKDTRTPVRIGVWCVVLNLVLNVAFVLLFPENWKHGGLALATVISSTVNALILCVILHRRLGNPGWTKVFKGWACVLIVTALMAVVLMSLQSQVSWFAGDGGKMHEVASLAGAPSAVA